MDYLRTLTTRADQACTHAPAEIASPSGSSCAVCGSTRNLRMCADCGHVGCCDSQAADARRHARETKHEVMVAMPVGSSFTWCYACDRYL